MEEGILSVLYQAWLAWQHTYSKHPHPNWLFVNSLNAAILVYLKIMKIHLYLYPTLELNILISRNITMLIFCLKLLYYVLYKCVKLQEFFILPTRKNFRISMCYTL